MKAIVVFFILLSGFLMGGVSSKLLLKSASEKSINQIAKQFTESYQSSEFNTNVELKKVKGQVIDLFNNDKKPAQTLETLKCEVADNLDLIEETCPISQKIIDKAKRNFSTSKDELQNIEKEIQSNIEAVYQQQINSFKQEIEEMRTQNQTAKIQSLEKKEKNKKTEKQDKIDKIKKKIKEKIKVNESSNIDLQTCVLLSCSSNEDKYKENWVKAIYSYQQNRGLKPTGILETKTANLLKQQVIEELDIPES